VELEGILDKALPWGANGEGPAGWTDILPLPLHWFVHSLGSKITKFNFKNKKTGETVNIKSGTAH